MDVNIHTHHMKITHTLLAAFIGLHGLFFVVLADARSPAPRMALVQTQTAQTLAATDTTEALLKRRELLAASLTVKLTASDQSGALATMNLKLADTPSWIILEQQRTAVHAVVDARRIKQHLLSFPPAGISMARSCFVASTHIDEQGLTRAETNCIAKNGYSYDTDALVLAIKDAFETQTSSIDFALTQEEGRITDGSGTTLALLGNGHSTFQGSGLGRKSNVRKAINERVNNVVVPEGAVFSFNDTLGTVSISRGWHMALTIFEGVNLRPAPGGGICQASTTTYRAALAAGFPILEQKNHSLYVTYYEKFGVGQDATIFPGKQNLTFLNDSGGPLLIQAYTEGDEAFVNIYGHDDGRRVAISGPYFNKTSGADALGNGKTLRLNEIGWIRTVTMPGQEAAKEVFVARYNSLPKSLAGRSKTATTITRGEQEHVEVADR
jgi:vancomycin resistance protein YoaR